MNLDKLDIPTLLRTLFPGLTFMIVVLSYFLFDIERFSILKDLVAVGGGFLILIASLGIGAIIQYFYYGFIHVGLGERDKMQKDDADTIRKIFGDWIKDIRDDEIDFAIDYCLNDTKNNEHKERNYFYFHQIHSYGASIYAIIFGMFIVVIGIIIGYFKLNSLVLFYPWSLIAFGFYTARNEGYKKHLRTCRDVYIKNNIKDIEGIIKAIKGNNF